MKDFLSTLPSFYKLTRELFDPSIEGKPYDQNTRQSPKPLFITPKIGSGFFKKRLTLR